MRPATTRRNPGSWGWRVAEPHRGAPRLAGATRVEVGTDGDKPIRAGNRAPRRAPCTFRASEVRFRYDLGVLARLLGLTALLATAVACDGAPARQLDWRVVFIGGADSTRARVLRASIREGSCTGTALYTESVRVDGSSTPMLPPVLGPGRYGFQVAAIDASCVPYAAGCVEVDLPQPEGSTVVVELAPQIGTPLCGPVLCSDGECGVDGDASVPDGGMDGGTDGGTSACPAGFADCNFDTADRCETPLDAVESCGGCWMACQLDHATAACSSGNCAIAGCDGGWRDCDSAPANGCETSLETLTDCGDCGARCELANAVEQCAGGGCTLVSCHPGYDNCDGDGSNGCERSLETATDCGSCSNTCGALNPICAIGPASVRCEPGCTADAPTLCGDVCVDLTSDAQHCSGCGARCVVPNAAASCSGSTCGIGACDPRWGNCDGGPGNGCEQSLTTRPHCGGCGATCDSSTGVLSCSTGACRVDLCLDGMENCDGVANNGCEADLSTPSHCASCDVMCTGATPLCGPSSGAAGECLAACAAPAATNCAGRCIDTTGDRANCGGCGLACALDNATAGCAASVCRVASCAPGFADCDGDDATGCEARLDGDPLHCGGCGIACPAGASADATCSGGICGSVCRPGFGDCDGSESSGCEQTLTTLEHCGGCALACSRNNATASCASGTCQIEVCTGSFDNCDGRGDNGCEADKNADRDNCGMCGNRCIGGGGRMCCGGTCGTC